MMKKIKSKIACKVMSAVAIATAFFIGVMPMTAYAGGYDCTCEEKCTEDHVNCDCELCKINPDLCCGADPEEESTDTVSENEAETDPEEEEEETYGPLTPDGNMTLVDDYGSMEAGGKQFITVVTKAGNYFYIIIDRDDNGTETVHFLNMVDEADLLALMDEEEVDKYIAATGGEEETTEPVVEEPQTEEPEETEETDPEAGEKKTSAGPLVLVIILAIGGAGVYIYFTKFKNKKPQVNNVDPDADYNEDEEDYLDSLGDEVDEIMTEDEENDGAQPDEEIEDEHESE